nr:hypothetical protein [Tanacetum cinerariifolium]
MDIFYRTNRSGRVSMTFDRTREAPKRPQNSHGFIADLVCVICVLRHQESIEERSLNNNSFLEEYECSSLAHDRDEKKKLDHLKQDQTTLVIKRFSERKKVFKERKKTGKIQAKRMVVNEIEDGLLEEMDRSLDGGLSKTLMERVKMNTCNNDKNLSEIQLEHEREDEFVMVVVKVVHELDCRMVVKEIEDGLLEEMERSLDGGLSKTLMERVKMVM